MDQSRRFRIDECSSKGSRGRRMYLPAMAGDQNATDMFRLMCSRGVFDQWQWPHSGHRLELIRETASGSDHRVTAAVPTRGAADPFKFEGMQARILPTLLFHGPFGGLERWWPYTAAVLIAVIAAVLANGPAQVLLWVMCAALFAIGSLAQARGSLPYRPEPGEPRWAFSDEWNARMAAIAIQARGLRREVMGDIAAQLATGRRFNDLDAPPEVLWAFRRGRWAMERIQYLCDAAEADIRTADSRVVVQGEGAIWKYMTITPDDNLKAMWPTTLEIYAQACNAAGWCVVVGCHRPRGQGDRCDRCDPDHLP